MARLPSISTPLGTRAPRARSRSAALLVAGAAATSVALACGTAPRIPAAVPRAAALDLPVADGDARPLVVDMTAAQRDGLAAAMGSSVAVVAYTGHSIDILPQCHAPGDYGLVAITPRAVTATLHGEDETVATLPVTGVALASALARDGGRSPSIEITATVGSIARTTRGHAAKGDLTGACEGATHFVYGALLGAFRVASAPFSGTYGDPELCAKPGPDASKAPRGCDAPIALELRAVDAPVARADDAPVARECPRGYVFAFDKCMKESAAAHRCTPGDARECARECDLGDARSCVDLGDLAADSDGSRALGLWGKACNAHAEEACRRVGERLAPNLARPILDTACAAGDAKGCEDLAALESDADASLRDLVRGCEGGDASACAAAGERAAAGHGVPVDLVFAAGLSRRGCEGDEARGCDALGAAYARGAGTKQSKDTAYALFGRACDEGLARACAHLADLTARGTDSRAAKPTEALVQWRKACDAGEADGCASLADATARGAGLPADLSAALAAYEKACALGAFAACARAGDLYAFGVGTAVDLARANALYKTGADGGDATSLRRAGERGPSGDATAFFARSCGAHDPSGCFALGRVLEDLEPANAVLAFEAGCAAVGSAGAAAGDGHDGRATSRASAVTCDELSRLVEDGRGAPADASRAQALARRACDGGSARACTRLAGVKPSAAAARAKDDDTSPPQKELLARGCQLGDFTACDLARGKSDTRSIADLDAACTKLRDQDACARLGARYRDGAGVTAAQDRAVALFGDACTLGDGRACAAAADLVSRGAGTPEDAWRASDLDVAGCRSGSAPSCLFASRAATDPAESAGFAKSACDLGLSLACVAYADAERQGRGVTKDAAAADATVAKACAAGEPLACDVAGAALAGLGVEHDGPAKDAAAGIALLQQGCDAHGAAACVDLGRAHLRRGDAPPSASASTPQGASAGVASANDSAVAAGPLPDGGRDVDAAATAFQSACAALDDDGCVALAFAYERGEGVPEDSGRAAQIDGALCDRGVAGGCGALARVLAAADPPDPAGAARAATRACNGLDFEGCRVLAAAYAAGTGVPMNTARSVAIRETTCDAGDADGCASLAYDYFAGKTVPKSAPRAAALFESACDLDHARGCDGLADLYAMGQGEGADDARAFALYGRACTAGYDAACLSLGFMYLAAKGAPKDEDHAWSLFQQYGDHGTRALEDGCDLGVARDCTVAGVVFQRSGDNAAAAKWLREGCTAGDVWACGYIDKTE